jgi:hypothetical protein
MAEGFGFMKGKDGDWVLSWVDGRIFYCLFYDGGFGSAV